jgi:Fe-S-cluster containining protein
VRDPARERQVPCGECRQCCKHELVFLHPEDGDDPAKYFTRIMPNPLTGELQPALVFKPGTSECIYLRPEGCGIYDWRPAICRGFDCRGIVKSIRRKLGPKRAATLIARSEVLQEGARRLRGKA